MAPGGVANHSAGTHNVSLGIKVFQGEQLLHSHATVIQNQQKNEMF